MMIFGMTTFLAAIFSLTLDETLNKPLSETLEDDLPEFMDFVHPYKQLEGTRNGIQNEEENGEDFYALVDSDVENDFDIDEKNAFLWTLAVSFDYNTRDSFPIGKSWIGEFKIRVDRSNDKRSAARKGNISVVWKRVGRKGCSRTKLKRREAEKTLITRTTQPPELFGVKVQISHENSVLFVLQAISI